MKKKDGHLWEGQFVSDKQLQQYISNIQQHITRFLELSINLEILIYTLDQFSQILKDSQHEYYKLLFNILSEQHPFNNVSEYLNILSDFISYDNLILKLKRELNISFPKFDLTRVDFKTSNFEGWYPLGVLVHICSSNYPLISVLSGIEGLLSGNTNFIKISSSDTTFAQNFFNILCTIDQYKQIQKKIHILKISSSEIQNIKPLLNCADALVLWGSESAIQNIKALCSYKTKCIEWGPKISFAYIAKSKLDDLSFLEHLSKDICKLEQQSCSSPQIIFVDTHDKEELECFADKFASIFDKISSEIQSAFVPSIKEQEEISIFIQQAKVEQILEESRLIEDRNHIYRIFVKYDNHMIDKDLLMPSAEELFLKRSEVSGVTKKTISDWAIIPSPLYRTIIIQPLVQSEIISKMKNYSYYLQTVSINCDIAELVELSKKFYIVGASRITYAGYMNDSYIGEPHDGVYALQRYMKRVSMSCYPLMDKYCISRTSELIDDTCSDKYYSDFVKQHNIMNKEEFLTQPINFQTAQIFFKSGGTSGHTKISTFGYDEYHEYMKAAAEGLFAAGLDVNKDRVMNLFFAGSLYGGFVSFWTILEALKVCQFPMGACDDFKYVAQNIIKYNVNVLLGMPSYLIQLFQNAYDELFKYRGIKKIFYGGERFSLNIIDYLYKEFGIESIKSASYGSVDAGPLGFQCQECTGTEYHLHERLQYLEILKLDQDLPVEDNEIGRLVFTPKFRRTQQIIRYDIGDLGRWINEPCACKRHNKKFELLGRHGDIARVGTIFLNYQHISKIIYDKFLEFKGNIQIVLDKVNNIDSATIFLSDMQGINIEDVTETIIQNYPDIRAAIEERVLMFNVKNSTVQDMQKSAVGKIINIVDLRK